MAEPKLTAAFVNRRLQNRYTLPMESGAVLSFPYPPPHGPRLETRIRDVSLSGLSIELPEQLWGIEAGDIVKGIEARVERKTFRGDLLVMHVGGTKDAPTVCGGLFYPEGDEDLITIRLIVRALDAASNAIS